MKNWYFNQYMPRMIDVLKKHYKPRPGLAEILQRIDSPECSIKTAVYSDYPFLKERMQAIGLPAYKQIRLFTLDTFGAQKPAVRPFLEIAKEMGLPPKEILVIGDRIDTDGHGAFSAGMQFYCLEASRKNFLRLDPNLPTKKDITPHDPIRLTTLPNGYTKAGKWDELLKLLLAKIS